VSGISGPSDPASAGTYPEQAELEAHARERRVTFAWLPAESGKRLLPRTDLPALAALALSGPEPGTVYSGREGLRVLYAYAQPGFPALWEDAPGGPDAGGAAPGGRPAPGVTACLLDGAGRPVPPGAPGGIRLGGEALGRPWGPEGRGGAIPGGAARDGARGRLRDGTWREASPGEAGNGSNAGEGGERGLFMPDPFRRSGPPLYVAPEGGWWDEDGTLRVLGRGAMIAAGGRLFAP
jgi:hypothetical protein